ncbi:MAG TPA: hypothetical protein VGP15_03350 [Burkholderiales bacterium]|nr:hypothetical protein [Burkholderiales bacterium]
MHEVLFDLREPCAYISAGRLGAGDLLEIQVLLIEAQAVERKCRDGKPFVYSPLALRYERTHQALAMGELEELVEAVPDLGKRLVVQREIAGVRCDDVRALLSFRFRDLASRLIQSLQHGFGAARFVGRIDQVEQPRGGMPCDERNEAQKSEKAERDEQIGGSPAIARQ